MNGISKFTLIIVILWTCFWIFVGIGGGKPTVNGIIVYIFVGLPTTLLGWFLWWLKHPEDKPDTPSTPQRKRIPPTSHPIGQPNLQKVTQYARNYGLEETAKRKNDVMHYLRCADCGLEDFLENEADGQQYCIKCGWKKR